MRKLTTVPALLIIIFLVNCIEKYPDDLTKLLIAWATLFMAFVLVVTKIKPGGKQKTKGYILRG